MPRLPARSYERPKGMLYVFALKCKFAVQQIGGRVEVAQFWARRPARRSRVDLRLRYTCCIVIDGSADASCSLVRLRHFLTAFFACNPKTRQRVLITFMDKH